MRSPCRVLFVCTGNICRSPLAEGVLRRLVDERGWTDRFEIDSAGTGGWHAGDVPDPRSCEVANRHGVDLSRQRARQVRAKDAANFDWILAMDEDNLDELRGWFSSPTRAQVLRLRDFDPEGPGDVPDPYYGGPRGFDDVYEMVERSCVAFLERWEESGC